MIAIDQIRIEDRHRKDLGDLSGLAASIRSVGLLHPVVVTRDGRLVAGQRRLAACGLLGWSEIPVTVAESLGEARVLLEAERDENTCRLDMKPSEKVALGKALEELERPRAAERMTLGKISPGSSRGDRTGKVYDLVGEAVGMSGPTYKRAKAVVREAEAGDPVAVQALEEMDRTGKVLPAYDKVANGNGAAPRNPIKQRHMPAAAAVVPRVLSALRVQAGELERALNDGTVQTEEAAGWSRDLSEIRTSLTRSINSLKEHL